MAYDIHVAPYTRRKILSSLTAPYVGQEAERVRRVHEGIAGYAPTPLVSLNELSKRLGVEGVYLKDESKRFSLNAFKSLGGSWAVARLAAEKLRIPMEEMSWDLLRSPETLARLKGLTLVTATDGNHGRGVAWVARQLGLPAVVFMPEDTVPERLQHIKDLGATASILPMNYDDTRRHAEAYAKEIGGQLVQDTAWGDYRQIPEWIMQGYVTIGEEILSQLKGAALPQPTHVFLQSGAGSFPAALAAYLNHGENKPFTAIIEPHGANCFYRTALANDGQLHAVTGRLQSIMAGLCVGEPSTLAWEILSGLSDAFVSCEDAVSVLGMRAASAPLPGDPRVISGESGAVGLGLVIAAMTKGGEAAREKLRLDKHARILLISTEGDTDSLGWRRLVWGLPGD